MSEVIDKLAVTERLTAEYTTMMIMMLGVRIVPKFSTKAGTTYFPAECPVWAKSAEYVIFKTLDSDKSDWFIAVTTRINVTDTADRTFQLHINTLRFNRTTGEFIGVG